MTLALGLLALPVVLDTFTSLDTGLTALAGNGNGGGGGGGEGGGGNGGNPGDNNGGGKGAGKSGGKSDKGGLYGDQVYILRDEFGRPILFTGTDAEGNDYSCFRPLAIGGDWDAEDGVTLPLVGQFPDPNDIQLDAEMDAFCEDDVLMANRVRTRDQDRHRDKIRDKNRKGGGYIPTLAVPDPGDEVELEGCDVVPACAGKMTEVELGRLSVLRAPPKVLDRHRDEAIRLMGKAEFIWLDQGGRPVVDYATLDSPLINLALMREFLVNGGLCDGLCGTGNDIWVPEDEPFGNGSVDYTFLNAAAFGLGAGDDKLGAGVDSEVVIRSYLTMGIPFMDPAPMLDVLEYEGYDPSGLTANRAYLDFTGYEYDREAVFPGAVCWDEPVYVNGIIDHYVRKEADLLDAVFDGASDPGYSGLKAFAQTAEDARRVMLFVHDHNVVDVNMVFEDEPINCPPLN